MTTLYDGFDIDPSRPARASGMPASAAPISAPSPSTACCFRPWKSVSPGPIRTPRSPMPSTTSTASAGGPTATTNKRRDGKQTRDSAAYEGEPGHVSHRIRRHAAAEDLLAAMCCRNCPECDGDLTVLRVIGGRAGCEYWTMRCTDCGGIHLDILEPLWRAWTTKARCRRREPRPAANLLSAACAATAFALF